MRVIAYGVLVDYTDDYLCSGEDTTLKSVRIFAKALIRVFGKENLRAPNEEDTKRLLYTGHHREPTIVLEAVASQDLWIWHSFFGFPGSLNEINVLQRSLPFARLAKRDAPACNYTVNGHEYNMGYYLADGIYPNWATFVKTIHNPVGKKQTVFAKAQEAARKDIERAFGVLQARFAIVRGPAHFWDKKSLSNIMTACVILHNMIIEDERGMNLSLLIDNVGKRVNPQRNPDRIQAFLQTYRDSENRETHTQLQQDLIEHQWQLYGR
ncbi:uncharacterized protein LOC100835202 [Brachypodium distachyon]|uniref:uncharacterized protein LOC100835202 n=1 Tax=Brachypodium distachyon TaxID=15368 RepID=UPI0005300793|nr:uncharacterized protein LOC100835202 [Brachypodium distachyon]|eukprot:XP_010233036.1 uncharacterized protein LOC100835202 [Brachypodium distachyon]